MTTPSNEGTGRSGEGTCRKPRSRFVGIADLLVLAVWLTQVGVVFLYSAARVRFSGELFDSWIDALFMAAVIVSTLAAYFHILRERYGQTKAIMLSYALVFFSTFTSIIAPIMCFAYGS
jgi:hypothetical protein